MIKRFIVICLFLISSASLAMGYILKDELEKPLPFSEPVTYTINAGSSLLAVLNDMEAKGWIKYAPLWRYYIQYQKLDAIKKGEYLLPANVTLLQAMALFNEGKVINYRMTLVEGSTFADFKQQLISNELLIHTLPKLSDEQLLKELAIQETSLEGWFFPDTYLFESGDSDLDILQRAHQRMKEMLEQQWQQKAKDLPYKNPYEALIMASIVEKETAYLPEQTQIAGVFVRRLLKGMKLQTDPTVIYGLGAKFNGNLTRAHLRAPTAYNTYTIAGLPPTPISNPSLSSIKAALHPDNGNTLYFVAKGDGTSHFSVTLDEHNNAVNKYQRNSRSTNYQSAPTK